MGESEYHRIYMTIHQERLPKGRKGPDRGKQWSFEKAVGGNK